jgi:glyoxylase-like metal-dependent hydrolase (beta-lactamase superfamily II)
MSGSENQVWQIVAMEVARIPGLPLAQFVPDADSTESIDLACLAFVIFGPGGVLVVDPGPNVQRAKAQGFDVTEGRTPLLEGLRALTFAPRDVTAVIITHLHYDHAQYSGPFTAATMFVQGAELDYAETRPDAFYTDLPVRSSPSLRLLDGDTVIAPGVVTKMTRGHSCGHQAVIVHTAAGPICLAGDEAPLLANFDLCPPSTRDAEAWQRFITRARGSRWTLVPSHDPDFATFSVRTDERSAHFADAAR